MPKRCSAVVIGPLTPPARPRCALVVMSARIRGADACARGTTETMRPAKIVTTTSARSSTSSSSVDEKITAVPVRAASRTSLWISALPPTSTPRVGLVEGEQRGALQLERPAEQHLLLVAAAEAAGGDAQPVERNPGHRREVLAARRMRPPHEHTEPGSTGGAA